MPLHDALIFLAGCATLLVAPGPTNALLLAAGAQSSWRRIFALCMVVVSAYGLSIGAAQAVIEPVAAAYPLAGRVMRAGIGVYVLLLAVRLWSATLPRTANLTVRRRDVFLTTLLNPKGMILAFVLLPKGGWEIWPYVLMMLGVILLASLLWGGAGRAAARYAGVAGLKAVPRLSAIGLGVFGSLALLSAVS